MMAVSSKAASRINEQFRAKEIGKRYLAIVEGQPERGEVLLEDILIKDRISNMTRVGNKNSKDGKFSRLSYFQRSHLGNLSLLEVRPETGRSHQIRVQLSSRRLPIVGDQKYGSQLESADGICLHAWRLQFRHPISREQVEISCDPPSWWSRFWPDFPQTVGKLG